MPTKKSESELNARLPIKLDSSSNGEYWPLPPSERLSSIIARARADTEDAARKLGMTRRDYLASACGAATVLLAMNQLGCGGGSYRAPPEAAHDQDAAKSAVAGDEFIFDVQTHQVSADRPWWDVKRPSLADYLKTIPQAECGDAHWARCFSDDVLVREVFLESDTQLAVVSALRAGAPPASRHRRALAGPAGVLARGRPELSDARPALSTRNARAAQVGPWSVASL